MKRMLFLGVLALGIASARASVFYDSVASLDTAHVLDGATLSAPVEAGYKYTLPVNDFRLDGSHSTLWKGDIPWKYKWDVTPVPTAFNGVTLRIRGTIKKILGEGDDARLTFAASEKVYEIIGGNPDIGNPLVDELDVGDVFGFSTTAEAFEVVFFHPFTHAASWGEAHKDILQFTTTRNTFATITAIEQEYSPVPEPASLAALGLGAAALLRRRSRK